MQDEQAISIVIYGNDLKFEFLTRTNNRTTEKSRNRLKEEHDNSMKLLLSFAESNSPSWDAVTSTLIGCIFTNQMI